MSESDAEVRDAKSARVHKERVGWRLQGSFSLENANRFLEMLSVRGLSSATIRAYAFDLVSLFRWLEHAHLKLAQLDRGHLLGFIEHQQKAGSQPNSINRRLITCEQFFKFVTGASMSAANISGPAGHYKGRGKDRALGLHQLHRVSRRKFRVKAAVKVVEPLTVSQVKTLLASARRFRDLSIIYLMLFCGLRAGEVLGLRGQDFAALDGVLRVRGKGNRERVLPLAHTVSRVVTKYLQLERPKNIPTEQLFVVLQGPRRGRPMTPAGLRTLFRHRRTAQPVLRNANAHRLRHTFGADMARAGVRLPILQRMMGHADGKTTLQYINLSMSDVAAEYQRAVLNIEQRYAGAR
ncbi:MAG: tyrosine-type recombinase/integrase [Myxococcaceae bacterium]